MLQPAVLMAFLALSGGLGEAQVSEGICSKYLDALRQRSPVLEARDNVGWGDRHLLAITGVGLIVRGMPLEIASKLVRKYGLRRIEHTSDAIPDDSCADYQSEAADFAEAYNKEVLVLVGSPR